MPSQDNRLDISGLSYLWSKLKVLFNSKTDKVSGATNGNFASLDTNGNLQDSGHKHSDYLTSHQDISGKADKVSNATNGNFAGLNSSGNIIDSGHKASDFLTQHQDISGKLNIAQGIENAGKFLIVNSSGNVVPVTMQTWQGGSY